MVLVEAKGIDSGKYIELSEILVEAKGIDSGK